MGKKGKPRQTRIPLSPDKLNHKFSVVFTFRYLIPGVNLKPPPSASTVPIAG